MPRHTPLLAGSPFPSPPCRCLHHAPKPPNPGDPFLEQLSSRLSVGGKRRWGPDLTLDPTACHRCTGSGPPWGLWPRREKPARGSRQRAHGAPHGLLRGAICGTASPSPDGQGWGFSYSRCLSGRLGTRRHLSPLGTLALMRSHHLRTDRASVPWFAGPPYHEPRVGPLGLDRDGWPRAAHAALRAAWSRRNVTRNGSAARPRACSVLEPCHPSGRTTGALLHSSPPPTPQCSALRCCTLGEYFALHTWHELSGAPARRRPARHAERAASKPEHMGRS